MGTCTIDADQIGDSEYVAAPQAQQSFPVDKGSQLITFLSSPPATATVGGTAYVAAVASSGLPVSFASSTGSVCSTAGSTVTLIGSGTCTISADQTGDSEYEAAPEAQQSFAVAPAPAPISISTLTPTVLAAPNNNFNPSTSPVVNPKTGAVTFTATVADPGTLSWLITFQGGKPGRSPTSKTKCAGQIEINGKCGQVKVVFGEASMAVASAGIVDFTVTPSASAREALKRVRGLPVTAILTFQSTLGGPPVSHTSSILIKLKTADKGQRR